MLETVRNTALPLFMGNVYSLMVGPAKTTWLEKCGIKNELKIIRKNLKKLAVKSCCVILDVTICKHVGHFSKNHAMV